jgi:hypothetical protein
MTETVRRGTEQRAAVLQSMSDRRNGLPRQRHSPEHVDDVLRSLPSHGWTAGWLGRRDRALLVLSQIAQLPYADIAALTAGEVKITGGVAKIKTPGGTTTVRQTEDNLVCAPCALARWVHALDLTVVYPDGRVIAAVIARAVPLTPQSPHLCESNNAITEVTRRLALLPPIDQWGHPVRAVSTRSAQPLPIHGRDVLRGRAATALATPLADREEQRANGLEQRVDVLLGS